jgi:hypothetical protein
MYGLCALEAVAGIALIAIALMRFGGFRRITRGNFGLGSILFFVGLMLLAAAAITGYIANDRAENRRQLDQALVKMFGRAPDELDLQGNTLLDFQGTMRYDNKRYRLRVITTGGNDRMTKYEVEATPTN